MTFFRPRPGSARALSRVAFLGAASLLIFGQPASAQTIFTWTGGGGVGQAEWSRNNNWAGPAPSANTTNSYVFGGNLTRAELNPNNGLAGMGANSILFAANATNSFNLIGTNVNMVGGMTNLSTLTQTNSMALTLVTNAVQFNTASNNITLAGVISGSGQLVKVGSSTLFLTAANTYTNATVISAGTLQVGQGTDAGSMSASTTITNNGALIWNVGAGLRTNNAVISGTGTLAQSGTGTLTLGGVNTYTGTTTINSGAIVVTNASALGATNAGTTVVSGGQLGLSGGVTIASEALSLAGTGISSGGALRNISGTNVYSGAITLTNAARINSDAGLLTLDNAGGITGSGFGLTLGGAGNINVVSAINTGAGSLTKDGAGTATLSGSNTYSGGTLVSAGALQGTTTSLRGNITNNAAVIFNQATDGTYSNVISGTGALHKDGTGTVTTTGANTFSGTTTVKNGRLVVDGTNASSAVTVNSGASLGGTGRVGALTVSGLVAPGNSVGTLSASNTVFNPGGSFELEIFNFGGAAGTGWDLLAITGSLTLSNTSVSPFTINLVSMTNTTTPGLATFNPQLNYTNTFVTYSGSLLGTAFNPNIFAINTNNFQNTTFGSFSVITNTGGLALVYTTTFNPNAAYTWTNGSGNWSLASGWTNNFAPTNGSVVIFSGGAGTATNNAQVSSLASVTFSNTTGSIVLAGDAFAVGTNGIANLSANAHTVSNNISLSGAATFNAASNNLTFAGNVTNGGSVLTVAGNNNTAISGAVSGAGGLTKSGNGTLTLSGGNTYNGGTLVSAGTVSGDSTSIQGNVTNNASLVFNQATNGTYAGALSGSGSMVKTNAGTLTLTGANSQSGTTVGQGTLQIGDGGTTGSLAGPITNNASLVFNRSDNLTQSNAITGSGNLTKQGAGTVTLTAANSQSGTTISAGTLQVGNGGTTGSLAGPITNNATLAFNRSDNLSQSGNISGTGSLTKLGNGTLTLSGANTYSGGTLVSAGTLAGNTTSLQGNISNNATVAFTQTADGTYAGTMSGTGALTKNGTGALFLTSSNSYNGGTTVREGELHVSANGALGTGSVTLAGTNPLSLAALHFTNTVSPLAIGPLTLNGNSSISLQAVSSIVSSGAFTVNSTNNFLSLGGNNWNQGTNTLVSGTSFTLGGSIFLTGTTINGGTLSLGSSTNIGRTSYTFGSNATSLYLVTGGVSFDLLWTGAQNNTWNASATNWQQAPNGLNPSGTNIAFVTDDNVYFGNAATSGGPITVAAGGVSAQQMYVTNTSGTVVFNGADIQAHNLYSSGAGNLTISNALQIIGDDPGNPNAGVFTNSGAGNVLLAGSVTQGTLVQSGSGTVTLAASNSYAGGTAVNSGTLRAQNADAFGTGAVNQANGSSLIVVDTAGTVDNAMSLYNISVLQDVTLSGAKTINGTTYNVASGTTANDSGVLSGAGALTKTGAGTLALGNANIYGGATTIAGGTVRAGTLANAGTASSIGTNGSVVMNNGGVLEYTGGSVSTDRRINLAGNGVVDVTSAGTALTVSGAITNSGALAKTGAGTLVLSGANTYSGGTLVSAGTLAGNTTSLQGNITNNAAVIFNQNTSGTYSGTMTGTGSLTKNGTGTVTTTANNTFGGATAVGAGRLVVNGTNANSAVTVNSGASLGGTGRVGSLTVSGLVAPGNSVGTLSVGDTFFNGGGAFELEMFDWTGSAGTGWDLLASSGNLTLNNTAGSPFTINLVSLSSSTAPGLSTNFNPNQSYTNTFVTFTGSLLGTPFNANIFAINTNNFQNAVNGTFSVITNAGGLALVYSTFFDPSAAYVWTNGSGNWSLASGWTNNLAPTNGATVVFSGGAGTATNNAQVSSLNSVTFSNTTGSIALAGSAFSIGTNGIANVSGNAHTISNNISLAGASTINAASNNLTIAGNVTNAGSPLTVDGAANTAINGVVSGAGSLTKEGSGTLTLSGANNYSGGTAVNDGTLAGNTTSLQGNITNNASVVFNQPTNGTYAGNMGGSGSLTKDAAGTLTLSGTNSYSGGTAVNAGAIAGDTTGIQGNITNNGAVIFNQNSSGTYAGNMSGSGALTMQGSGTLTLSGANTYGGGTLVTGGTLAVSSDGNLGSTNSTLTLSNGTLLSTASFTIDSARSISILGTNGTIDVTALTELTYNGDIVGSAQLTKAGLGTLSLGDSDIFTGPTFVSAGTLNLTTPSALSNSIVTVASNATLINSMTNADVSLGNLEGSGTVDAGSNNLIVGNDNVNTTFSGTVSVAGTNEFVKTGTGTMELSGTISNPTGTTVIDQGAIKLAGSDRLDTNGALNVALAGTLDLNTNSQRVGGLTGTGTITNSGGSQANLEVFVGAGTNQFAGVIAGSTAVQKTGTGAFELTGLNSYNGNTTVAGGFLKVTGFASNSLVIVQDTATLGGGGTVGGVLVETGGTISPGSSPGNMTIVGDVTWQPGGNYNWQIRDAGGTEGTPSGWDLITAGGQLDLSLLDSTNRFNINLWSLSGISPDTNGPATGFNPANSYTWNILTAAGGINNFSADKFNLNAFATNGTGGFVNNLLGGSFGITTFGGNTLALTYSPAGAIPEPGTWAAAALLVGAAAYARLRRRRAQEHVSEDRG